MPIAILSRKRRRGKSTRSTYVVDATCPSCSETRTLSFGGWTAITCPCGVVLDRPPAIAGGVKWRRAPRVEEEAPIGELRRRRDRGLIV